MVLERRHPVEGSFEQIRGVPAEGVGNAGHAHEAIRLDKDGQVLCERSPLATAERG